MKNRDIKRELFEKYKNSVELIANSQDWKILAENVVNVLESELEKDNINKDFIILVSEAIQYAQEKIKERNIECAPIYMINSLEDMHSNFDD